MGWTYFIGNKIKNKKKSRGKCTTARADMSCWSDEVMWNGEKELTGIKIFSEQNNGLKGCLICE